MIAGLIIFLITIYIAIVSRRYMVMFSGDRFPVKWMKAAGYDMYRRVSDVRGICRGNVQNQKVYKMMLKKYGPVDTDREWVQYQSVRYAWVLTGVMGVCALIFICNAADSFQNDSLVTLIRPDYGSAAEHVSLECEDSAGHLQNIELELQAVQYPEEEVQKLFSQYKSILEQKVVGENASLTQVCKNLDFAPEAGWEVIEVTWNSSDATVISEDGIIDLSAVSEGKTDMMLYLTLSYEEYQEMYDIPITVIKHAGDYEESLPDYLRRMEEDGRTMTHLDLPENYGGRKITYREKKDLSKVYGIMVLIFLGVIWKWQEQCSRLKEFLVNREKQMILDYPDIITELLIYLRAGMPVKNAWKKMVHDYECQKVFTGKTRYALESMKIVLQEMNQGCGECEAYVRFGKRCEVPQYVKLGNLLQQNTKKGSSVLMELLKREQIEAQECRKRQIRAAGETAGSKLMLPMIVLFILVMMIIMVPAFMSFSISGG